MYKISNLETPVAKNIIKDGHMKFNCEEKYVPCFKERFDHLNLANNHMYDQGP